MADHVPLIRVSCIVRSSSLRIHTTNGLVRVQPYTLFFFFFFNILNFSSIPPPIISDHRRRLFDDAPVRFVVLVDRFFFLFILSFSFRFLIPDPGPLKWTAISTLRRRRRRWPPAPNAVAAARPGTSPGYLFIIFDTAIPSYIIYLSRRI